MKKKCTQLTCRYYVRGLISEKSRVALCNHCINFSNFEKISEEDMKRIAPAIVENPIFPLDGRWDARKIADFRRRIRSDQHKKEFITCGEDND